MTTTFPVTTALNIVATDFLCDTKQETYKWFFKIKKKYACLTVSSTANWIIRNQQLGEEANKRWRTISYNV